MTSKFTDNGVPVIIGEYGSARGNDEASRVFFSEMFVKLCHENGIPAFLWDNGSELDRSTLQWQNPELVTALNRAVSGKDYEPVKE
ncbi:MAG: cellulase family glycosylhydrolase, partial [Porcipelethomonas sp.]